MDRKEEQRIREWNDTLSATLEVRLVLTDDARGENIKRFAKRLSKLAANVHVDESRSDVVTLPSLKIGRNIEYHALPLDKELEPFLEALESSGGTKPSDAQELKKITLPARLELFIALECSFCPEAVRKVIPLAGANPLIQIAIIDAALFDDVAKAGGVRSVPTVVLDGQYRWTGEPPVADIVHMMIHRNPSQLGVSAIESMLKEGDAEQVAMMMIQNGAMLPAFIELLAHEKWHVRLGAMVAMESILEKNADLAASAAAPLWDRAETVDNAVKGDILYTIGKIGDARIIPELESAAADPGNTDLREAAKEAIESIRNRQAGTEEGCGGEEADTCSLPDDLE